MFYMSSNDITIVLIGALIVMSTINVLAFIQNHTTGSFCMRGVINDSLKCDDDWLIEPIETI